MPRRNSPKDIKDLEDLAQLEQVVVDKRNHKRADTKKNRRDRHYQKQFIKNVLSDTKIASSTPDSEEESK